MKALLIEDNRADYVLLKLMLEENFGNDIEIHNAQKLSRGIALMQQDDYDIILLDLGLPDSSGFDSFFKIHEINPKVPIIILSGLDDEDTAVRAVRSGAQDYLSKNQLNSQLLTRAVRYAIERKQTEEALKESEEKFKIIFNEALDVIMIIDSYSGLVLNINPAAFVVLGYKQRDLIGKHYSILFPNEQYFNRYDLLSKVVINGAVIESQDFIRSDSSMCPMDMTASIIPWGKTKAILVSLRDASERKAVEIEIKRLYKDLEKRVSERTAQLEAAMSELKNEITIRRFAEEKLIKAKNEITKAYQREKELNELKTRFITMVSHEYRTPLSVISSSAEFLELYDKTSNPEKHSKHINRILDSVESMTQLLEDVLTVGKIESGDYKAIYDKIDINQLLESVLETVKDELAKPINIDIEFEPEKITFITDMELLRHVLIGIVSNAVKYSNENQKVKISIVNTGKFLQFKVLDEGIGIPENDLPYIFEPFFRGSNIGNTSGFGIGLQIAKGCSEILGIKLGIEKNEPQGTIVNILLPEPEV